MRIVFSPEVGGSMSLRNIITPLRIYTASNGRRH